MIVGLMTNNPGLWLCCWSYDQQLETLNLYPPEDHRAFQH